MKKEVFIPLVDRYLEGTASDAEKLLLEEYYKRLEAKGVTELSSEEERYLQDVIYKNVKPRTAIRKIIFYRLTAVAAAVIIIISSWWLFIKKEPAKPEPTVVSTQIMPGRDAAVLTLADGKTIYLDSVKGKIESAVNADGLLTYEKNNKGEIQYHTLTTSRGNQYKIILPDGSKLMLNSATSIKFPSAFINNKREVELIYGEAYFEIEKGKSKPFIVNNGENKIEVLGTTFNINNYKEEGPAATTLVTGSVKISGKGADKILLPGQQAIYANNKFNISNPDITKTIAWTTGFFEFDKMDLKSVMRQISRWYDIDIIYENLNSSENDARFGGRISRNLPLSNILKLLEANGLKFRLEGNKLIIM
ncbi:MAG: FecR domain-containing protein [Chitinophagaceae bacterium]|nr:FecR domain-containing protein [Chitinophagaceae bacterium]